MVSEQLFMEHLVKVTLLVHTLHQVVHCTLVGAFTNGHERGGAVAFRTTRPLAHIDSAKIGRIKVLGNNVALLPWHSFDTCHQSL